MGDCNLLGQDQRDGQRPILLAVPFGVRPVMTVTGSPITDSSLLNRLSLHSAAYVLRAAGV